MHVKASCCRRQLALHWRPPDSERQYSHQLEFTTKPGTNLFLCNHGLLNQHNMTCTHLQALMCSRGLAMLLLLADHAQLQT